MREMAELAGRAVRTAIKLTIQHQRTGYPYPDRKHTHGLVMPSEAEELLGDRIGIRVVFQPNGNPDPARHEIAQWYIVPTVPIAPDTHRPLVVDDAGHSDANPGEPGGRPVGECNQLRRRCGRVPRQSYRDHAPAAAAAVKRAVSSLNQ